MSTKSRFEINAALFIRSGERTTTKFANTENIRSAKELADASGHQLAIYEKNGELIVIRRTAKGWSTKHYLHLEDADQFNVTFGDQSDTLIITHPDQASYYNIDLAKGKINMVFNKPGTGRRIHEVLVAAAEARGKAYVRALLGVEEAIHPSTHDENEAGEATTAQALAAADAEITADQTKKIWTPNEIAEIKDKANRFVESCRVEIEEMTLNALAKPNGYAVIRVDTERKSSRDREGNRTSYTEILATLYATESVDQVAQDKLDDADADYVLLDRVEHILDDEDEEDIEATSSAVTEAEERLVKSLLTDGYAGEELAQAQSVRVYFPYYDETYVRGENGFEEYDEELAQLETDAEIAEIKDKANRFVESCLVESNEMALNALVNEALFIFEALSRIDKDAVKDLVHKVLKVHGAIALIWDTSDVLEKYPSLTEEEARAVLEHCEARYECDLGMTHSDIENAVERLHPDYDKRAQA